MKQQGPLHLHEELALLAIRDRKGTFAGGFVGFGLAGAVLAELLLDQRITIDPGGRQLVELSRRGRVGDPVIDEFLDRMKTARRRASLKTWISRLGRVPGLRHKVASQLCARRILRHDEVKVLFLFTRHVYPELDPGPERELVQRLRQAIFTDRGDVDPRTAVLVALADGLGLLAETFGRRETRQRRQRIGRITSGDLVGHATREVITACQAAAAVAATTAAIAATTGH